MRKSIKYLIVFVCLGLFWTFPLLMGIDRAEAVTSVAAQPSQIMQTPSNLYNLLSDKVNALTKNDKKQDRQIANIKSDIKSINSKDKSQDKKIANVKTDINSINSKDKSQDKKIASLESDISSESNSALFLYENNTLISEKGMLTLLVWYNFDVTVDKGNSHVYYITTKKHRPIPRPLPSIEELLKKYPDLLVAYPLFNRFLAKSKGNSLGYPWVWEMIS